MNLKIKHTAVLFGLFLLSAVPMNAQINHPCGTSSPEDVRMMTEMVLESKAFLEKNPQILNQEMDILIPVTIHVLRRSDGSAGVSEWRVLDYMCRTNQYFEETGMKFYIKQFKYFDRTAVYENPTTATTFLRLQEDDSSVNLFIAQNANTAGGQGTTLGYYSPGEDWLVVRLQEVNFNNATLGHELGHFFGLPHPHNGWDSESYEESVHGNPAPALSPGGVPTECQDGSNCNTAGDMICDTPPDYNFGFGWSDCDYDAGTMDPCGDVVDPGETLIMGYFLGCPLDDYIFSEDQKAIMIANYNTQRRNYIRNGARTSFPDVEGAPVTVAPTAGSTSEFSNVVTFEWEPVAGAEAYILEVARNANFTVQVYRDFVFGTSRTLTSDDYQGLESAGRILSYRVRAYNGLHTCETYVSDVVSFTTGQELTSSTNEITMLSEWSVVPNPVRANGELMVNFDSAESFEAAVSVFNINGQLVEGKQLSIAQGVSSTRISTANFAPGVYFLSIQSGKEVTTRRVVVQ